MTCIKAKRRTYAKLTEGRSNVHVYNEDCNPLLLNRILPTLRYEDYRRALCILDPYGLHLDWRVIEEAGRLGTIDMFLNFPVMDINMNVLRRNPEGVDPDQASRLTTYWGDESWKLAAYETDQNLFGYEEKRGNEAVAQAFRRRLRDVVGFRNVLDPMPMRNDQGAIVYYLYFASPNTTGNKIARHILRKYESWGQRNG